MNSNSYLLFRITNLIIYNIDLYISSITKAHLYISTYIP